jgi:AcrR family transcriptional regulator
MSMDIKTRILEQAQMTFFQSGFYRVTVDELAHNLGISKKTLYKHFPSKEILLNETMQRFMDKNEKVFKNIVENTSGSVLEKLHQIFTHLGAIFTLISVQFTEDLRRYAPDIWQNVDRRRMQFLQQYVRPLIEMGLEEGVIRKGIPPDILFLIYSTLVQRILNPETLSRTPLSAKQAFTIIIQIFFQGTLTETAQERFRCLTSDQGDQAKGFHLI